MRYAICLIRVSMTFACLNLCGTTFSQFEPDRGYSYEVKCEYPGTPGPITAPVCRDGGTPLGARLNAVAACENGGGRAVSGMAVPYPCPTYNSDVTMPPAAQRGNVAYEYKCKIIDAEGNVYTVPACGEGPNLLFASLAAVYKCEVKLEGSVVFSTGHEVPYPCPKSLSAYSRCDACQPACQRTCQPTCQRTCQKPTACKPARHARWRCR